MVSRAPIKPGDDLCLECLPVKTRVALRFFSTSMILGPNWYLAGGTARALQAGHRRSFDLDFFTSSLSFDENALERKLLATKQWHTTLRQEGTLYGQWRGAKISFIAYPFFLPNKRRLRLGSVRILVKEDIAVMKVIAISQRGRRRDFVDLYWYCQHVESLASLLRRAPRQYPGQEENLPHFFKSLVYFNDADQDASTGLLFSVNWRTIKSFFRREVPRAMKELEMNPYANS